MPKSKKSNKSTKDTQWFNSKELKPDCIDVPKNIKEIVNRRTINQQDLVTTKFGYDVDCASDSSGNINTVLANNPNVTANWGDYTAVWDEYRCLAMEVQFKPTQYVGGASAMAFAPIIVVIDYDSIAALTGYTLGSQYSSQKEFPGGRPWKRTIYLSGVENCGFISTLSPIANGYIKTWSASNTVSLKLGRFHVEYFVQFRGLGI